MTLSASRSILHVDMDAFFASVEILDNPALRGKPVIVGGRPASRGVVAAASYEARAFGVHSAMSSARAFQLCPHAVFVEPRGRRYAEESKNVFKILGSFSPLVEPVSIDEAFLDVTGCEKLFGTPEKIGREIKRRIRVETGLVASVGVAPNMFLAKLASDLKKPDGFVVIRPGEAEALLEPLPVGKLWGVGKVSQEALARLEIKTIGELRDCPLQTLVSIFGSWAQSLIELAHGRDDRPVQPESEAKSIGAEITFAADIDDPAELLRQLDALVERVGRRLRAHRQRASTMNLKARFSDFSTVTRAQTLPAPTSATLILRQVAHELLETRLGRAGRPLRLIGFSCSNLCDDAEGQLDLFPDPKNARAEKLDLLVDRLKTKHGGQVINHGFMVSNEDRDDDE